MERQGVGRWQGGRCPVNQEPIALVRQAARGNLEAMRSLRDAGMSLATSCDDEEEKLFQYYEAAIFGRLAAEIGGLTDRAHLMGLLALQADILRGSDCEDERCRAIELEGEAVALAELVAEQGGEFSEETATMIVMGADAVEPEVFARAKHFKKLWGTD